MRHSALVLIAVSLSVFPLAAQTSNARLVRIEMLIQAGAAVNATASENAGGWTPLHGAAARGSAEIVSVLLKHGPPPTPGRGVVQGRVLWNGQPVPGAIAYVADDFKPGSSAQDQDSPRAAELSEAEILELAMAALPRNLAVSYLVTNNQLDLLAMVAQPNAGSVTLFLGGTRVTSDNVKDFEREYQTRKKAYTTAIGRRGFRQAAGAYRLETVQPCGEKPISGDVTLKQDAFRLELRLEPLAAGETGIPGAIVDATLVFGTGDMAGGSYFTGTIAGDTIDLQPFDAPGCVLRLTRR